MVFVVKYGIVYILSNKKQTVFYVGVTNNISRRLVEHKKGIGSKFTSRYGVNELVYIEQIMGFRNAIDREKQLKNWHREWKLNLIKQSNPEMKNLAEEFMMKEDYEIYSRI